MQSDQEIEYNSILIAILNMAGLITELMDIHCEPRPEKTIFRCQFTNCITARNYEISQYADHRWCCWFTFQGGGVEFLEMQHSMAINRSSVKLANPDSLQELARLVRDCSKMHCNPL